MKKILFTALCLFILIFAVSCGDTEPRDSGSSKKKPTSSAKPTSSEPPTSKPSDDLPDPFGINGDPTPTSKPSDNEPGGQGGSVSLKNAKVGDTVVIGSFEQDNDATNGKEPIEWFVIDKNDNGIMLISVMELDVRAFGKYGNTTWESSALRSWLNNYFAEAAFSAEELAHIPTVTVKTEDNANAGTSGGKEVDDRVFVLSLEEAERLLTDKTWKKGHLTEYAKAQPASIPTKNGWWWLRSPGANQKRAMYVLQDGSFYKEGVGVDMDTVGVRPVIWYKP